MYKANLSYEQVNYYLSDMLNKCLITQHIVEEGILYRTSEKGREYLKHYTRLMDLVTDRQKEEQTLDAETKEQRYILQY